MGEFGDKFRKAREKKELSLDDVSNVTKIGSRMLQAIEEEHFDLLPGGVFNKGFIRAYAKHLGLNDEEAVTDYLACLRQAQIDAHEVWEPQRPGQSRSAAPEKPRVVEPIKPAVKSQPPEPVEELPELQLPRAEDVRPQRSRFAGKSTSEIPWRILAITAVVVVLVILLWTRRARTTNTAAASNPPAKTVQVNPAQAMTVPVAISPSAPVAPRNQPTPASGSTPMSEHSPSPQDNKPAATSRRPASDPAAQPPADAQNNAKNNPQNNAQNNNDSDNNDVTVRTFPKSNPQPSEKSSAPLTLVIRATETSWISVLADGQTVSQETLIAPAHTSVRANREIVARIGNAAGVTFLWKGEEIPAAGAEAEVKTFVFDSTGMRLVPSAPTPAQNR